MIKRRFFAALQLACLGATLALPAYAQVDRAKQIGGKFMCMCNCNQVLTQCNHVGCTVSTSMLKELDDRLVRGESEATIMQGFVQEFGTQVYAEPPKSGISLVAWSLPTIYLAVGTVLVVMVIWRWRARPHLRPAAPNMLPGMSADQMDDVRQRVARETED